MKDRHKERIDIMTNASKDKLKLTSDWGKKQNKKTKTYLSSHPREYHEN